MSRIRSSGNEETELALIRIFRAEGITGWRRGRKLRFAGCGKTVTVRPDFVFPERKLAVFVDGEFWHGHPTRARIPKTRTAWWTAKIAGNKARDRMQNRLLRQGGWKVVRIWQYQLVPKYRSLALRKLGAAGL